MRPAAMIRTTACATMIRDDGTRAMAGGGRPASWRQGHEAGRSIGSDRLRGQGRVVIDDIQYLRLNLTDLGIDPGDRRGVRGVDATHQIGFLPQETDDVLDVME